MLPETGDTPPPSLTGKDIKAFGKAGLSISGKEVSNDDVTSVFSALGLDKSSHMTNTIKKESFAKGIWTLCDFHFGNYAENEQADILGELLFNSKVFLKESSDKVSAKSTASIASCVFNAVSLLRTIDSKAGSLNDSAVNEYYQMDKSTNITTPKRGKSILHPRHHLTGARKVASGLVDHLFEFVDTDKKPIIDDDESSEILLFEPAWLFGLS